MITKEELIAAGVDKLAAILFSLHQNDMYLRDQLDIIFAGLDKDPEKIVAMIKKEIAFLNQSTRYVDYREAAIFANTLYQLRLHIADDLFSKSPQHAMELMLEFLDLHKQIFERVDDSDASVGEVFKKACRDLGKICKHIQMPLPSLVDLVFTRFMDDGYGIYSELISSFQEALQEPGLKLLQEKFEQYLNSHNGKGIRYALETIAECLGNLRANRRNL